MLTLAILLLDGDSFHLNNKHYRIFGIDAPELHQKCFNGDECGLKAKQYLESILKAPVCFEGRKEYYGRTLVTCRANGQDIGELMIRSGNAVPIGNYYKSIKVEVNFEEPRKYRKAMAR